MSNDKKGKSGDILGSVLSAGESGLTGAMQGYLSRPQESKADRQRAASIKRQRSNLNRYGMPLAQLGTILAGWGAITGRGTNPQAERARQMRMATGQSLMQNQVAPGMPGYQQAKQQTYQQSLQQQQQMNPADVVGMMWALYMGAKTINQASGNIKI